MTDDATRAQALLADLRQSIDNLDARPGPHPGRAVPLHPDGRQAEGRARPAALGPGARRTPDRAAGAHVRREPGLDPEFAKKFQRFIIDEVIRHHHEFQK